MGGQGSVLGSHFPSIFFYLVRNVYNIIFEHVQK